MFRFGLKSFLVARNFSTKFDEIGNLVKVSTICRLFFIRIKSLSVDIAYIEIDKYGK